MQNTFNSQLCKQCKSVSQNNDMQLNVNKLPYPYSWTQFMLNIIEFEIYSNHISIQIIAM
jgi:hypothetical protein